MTLRPACPRLRALGAGVTLWTLIASTGCGAPAPAVAPPLALPPVARNLLNAEDLMVPRARSSDTGAPARPVARTAMRRGLMSAAFSPDSQRLFGVSSHGELVAYDVATGALRGYARPWYDGTYPTLQVDASGTRVLVAAPGRAFLWDLHTDRLEGVPSLGRGERAWPVALHPGGEHVARVEESADSLELVVSGLADGEQRRYVLTPETSEVDVVALAYSPSGARIALVADAGQTFTLLDATTLSVVQAEDLRADARHAELVDGVDGTNGFQFAFRPQGGQLARLRPGRLELLDSLSGRVRADVRVAGAPRQLAYSADGVWLVASSSDEAIVVEAATGRVSARVPLGGEGIDNDDSPTLRAVLPREGGFLVGNLNGEVTYYSAAGEPGEAPGGTPANDDHVPMRYSPDGAWALYDADTPYFRRYGESARHAEFVSGASQVSVWGVDFSLDGRVIYTHSRSGAVRFAGDEMRDLQCGTELPTQRASDGQLVQGSGELCLFEQDRATSRGEASTLDGHTTVRLEGDELVATRAGSARPVRLVRSSSSRVTCPDATCLRSARVAPDGSAVAFFDAVRTGSARTTWWEVYDTRSGRLRASGTRDSGYHQMLMLTGGAFIVHDEAELTLYDPRGRARLQLERVPRLATTPAGDRFVAHGADGIVHVVDVASGRERASWPAGAELMALGLSPDGQRVLALTSDRNVLVASATEGVVHTIPAASDDYALNFASTFLLMCADGRVVRYDLRSGEHVDVASCDGRPDAISEDGAFAVITMGSSTRVHRLADGRVLILETLVGEPPSLQLAYDDTGRWDASQLDAGRLRIRAAGPGESAPLASPETATRTEGLVGLFLSGH